MSEFQERYGRYAVIAGASEGIGAAFAQALATKGLDLVLVSRSAQKLSALGDLIRESCPQTQVHVAALDLTASDALEQIKGVTDGLNVGMLVYNAGAETKPHAPMVDGDPQWFRYLIDINATMPTMLCHHFGQALRARGRGAIVLVGSLAGSSGAYGNLVYAASKAYEHTLAEGLWAELEPHGIDVVGLIAGLTDTPALRRSRPQIDFSAAMNPFAVAADALARLSEGPIIFPEGIERLAAENMKLPRRAIVAAHRERVKQFYRGGK